MEITYQFDLEESFNMQRFVTSSIFCILLLVFSGCQTNVEQSNPGVGDTDKVAVISLTSDPFD